jgi:hypothetical protein
MLDPLPRRYTVCSHLFLPRCHRPSPRHYGSASRVCPTTHDFSQGGLSRLQIFRNVPASKFARRPDRTYRCDTAAGQPGLLRPGISCFVTSERSGYANRPKTGNWRYRDLHSVRLSALSATPMPLTARTPISCDPTYARHLASCGRRIIFDSPRQMMSSY